MKPSEPEQVSPKIFEKLDRKKSKDIKVLANFVAIFCRENHGGEARNIFTTTDDRLGRILGDQSRLLCADCRKLLNHGIAKRLRCPYEPKPMCKKCPAHCYAPGYRERIREVMRFSGLHLIKHGRLDLMAHYLF